MAPLAHMVCGRSAGILPAPKVSASCLGLVFRAEGPAVRPAKGNALANDLPNISHIGPTSQPYARTAPGRSPVSNASGRIKGDIFNPFEIGPMSREFSVVIERDEEGYFVASVPSLPGCHTPARSFDELTHRVREALALCLEIDDD